MVENNSLPYVPKAYLLFGREPSELSADEKMLIANIVTLAGAATGGAVDGSAGVGSGASAGRTEVENNYLSSKQIDAWSAEMKHCKAGGGDCGGIVTKYEELSTAQQKQLISDCATSPAACQQKYGDVLADSMAVKQALDRAMGEDIPIKMVYDLTATWAHQMDADGIVASNKVSEQIMAKYGLDQVQADIIAGIADFDENCNFNVNIIRLDYPNPIKNDKDILLEVTDLSELDKCNRAMAASGFDARGENGIAGRRYFTKGGDRRSHQVHAFEVGDEQIVKHLAFRDYLIENPQVAAAYAELKQNAAAVCRNDIKRYQQMKTDFISHYLKLAKEEPEARQKATKANGGSKAQIPRTDT